MVDLQKDLCQHPMPPRTAAASAPVPSLLDLFSPRLKKKSLEYKCFTMCYYFPLYNKVNQPKKKKKLMEILLYMIARLFTEWLNKVVVLILDFYHLLFSTFVLILSLVFKKLLLIIANLYLLYRYPFF